MKQFFMMIMVGLLLIVLPGCDNGDEGGNSSGGTEAAPPSSGTSTVSLSAFSDFSCTSNWTNRDGALGLSAGSGSGTCTTTFSGESGTYNLSLIVQTEFDGRSPYQVSINGNVVSSGTYPLSSPLGCDCPLDNWMTVCPDQIVTLNGGVHQINKGDTITFYGEETYPCGSHGAYAKWHGMNFTP